jgi:GNAT superfamily N-acetyltransferase
LYLENYNPPYYAPFFAAYGFQVEETIHTYRIPLESAPVSRVSALAGRLETRHKVRYAHIQLEGYRTFMNDFYAVYQASFQVGSRMNLLTLHDFEAVVDGYKHYLQEDLIWVLYVDGKPAGILALVPDLNNLLRNAIRPREPGVRVVKGFVFAVAPAYRKLGVDAALACRAYQVLTRDNQQTQLFLAGISTRSGRMISFIESMGARLSRIHTTYFYSCT